MGEEEQPQQPSFPGMGPLWKDPSDVNRHERRRNAEEAREKRPKVKEEKKGPEIPQASEKIGAFIFHSKTTIWLSKDSICILRTDLEADRTGKKDGGLTQYIARSSSSGYYNDRYFFISPDDIFTTYAKNERSNPRSRSPKKAP